MHTTLSNNQQHRQNKCTIETSFKTTQDLQLFHYPSVKDLPDESEMFHQKRTKTLEQLHHARTHYRKNYYSASAKGQRVLRFHLRKLEQQISELEAR